MVSWFFIGLVISILLTPGPTNTLLASSGIQVGFKKAFRLIPAEAFGYLIAITFWGILIGKISVYFPPLPHILKLFSAAYILFLALKLWRTAELDENFEQLTIRARELFFATLLNPKALLFASAIFPVMVWKSSLYYVTYMLVFLALLIPIAFFWTFLGTILARKNNRWLNQKNLQKTASIILMSFSVPLSYSALLSL
ncbi:LysE family translocator [Acinetobacter bohemicus]|uniref:LysE family translocator n=1 Tax=Acinetobacter lwoffii TaxID=28090 RepID=A0A9D2UUC5_ACILW|nr:MULTISPECIES: LysE family translocator [Acinetobacter]MDM1780867.1 LysE family translocator [Acinetobacter indicus]HJF28687.1 LysE family translocator [Acinetobacter lwoffii]MCO8042745.1 LysE family translocator [Acinetobacter sp. S4400-12]MCO8044301.1 LysE family translocator [Acinetobacter sp. S4397-1]MCU7225216.1 LysE family translocator [Acinetobacter bohemicus]